MDAGNVIDMEEATDEGSVIDIGEATDAGNVIDMNGANDTEIIAACSEYIYSEDFASFLVRYNNDLQGAYERTSPTCVTLINGIFLVAYSDRNYNDFYAYQVGYNSIPKCYGLMDSSAVLSTGADVVARLPGLNLTGKDVLVGFVDTGIDYTNPTFFDENGNTRIARIWDQTEEVFGTGKPIFGYGAEFTKVQIDSVIATGNYNEIPTTDEDGHGTFLASVAAGRNDISEDFVGMAPESEIVMVKLKTAKKYLRDYYGIPENVLCYSEDDIVLGVKYLIDVAIELQKPLVICLGIGTSFGAHDGTTNLELFLENLVGLRGVAVVTAAGNELGSRGHFAGRLMSRTWALADVATTNMELLVDENENALYMELWGTSPGLLKCSITSPTGERFTQIPAQKDGVVVADFLYEGTKVFVENLVVEPNTGDQLVIFRFEKPSAGIWTINVSAYFEETNTSFDAWLPIREFRQEETGFVDSNPETIICSPGNARSVITTAGYNHQSGAIYINSSRGYARNGRVEPILVAPAVNVQGVFATPPPQPITPPQPTMPPQPITPPQPATLLPQKATLYARRSGTSVAAAFSAGAAALLLEWGYIKGNFPTINTESIRQILIRGTKNVADMATPNAIYGWGALDLYNAFENMRSL